MYSALVKEKVGLLVVVVVFTWAMLIVVPFFARNSNFLMMTPK